MVTSSCPSLRRTRARAAPKLCSAGAVGDEKSFGAARALVRRSAGHEDVTIGLHRDIGRLYGAAGDVEVIDPLADARGIVLSGGELTVEHAERIDVAIAVDADIDTCGKLVGIAEPAFPQDAAVGIVFHGQHLTESVPDQVD